MQNVASSGVSSCAGQGDPIGRRSVSRRHTGRVWRLCVSCSDVSAHPNEQNASRSCPTYTCTASRLQDRRKSLSECKPPCRLVIYSELSLDHMIRTRAGLSIFRYTTIIVTQATSLTKAIHTVGWRNWENRLHRKRQLSN